MFVVSPKPIPNPLFPYWESQILKMIDPDWTNLIMVVPFPLSLINLVVGLSWPMKCCGIPLESMHLANFFLFGVVFKLLKGDTRKKNRSYFMGCCIFIYWVIREVLINFK